MFDKRNFSKDNPNSRLNALLKATLEQLRKHQSELVGIDDHSLFDTTHAAGASELPEVIINELMAAEEMDPYTHHLIRNSYRTALFYLLGGIESATTAVELQGKQLKSLYLSQLIAFAEGVAKFYTLAYKFPDEYDSDSVDEFREDTLGPFKIVRDDIEALPEDFGATHRRYLIDRSQEFTLLEKMLYQDFHRGDDDTLLNTTLKKTISVWRANLGDTDREVRELIEAFGLEKNLLKQTEYGHETLEGLLSITVEEKMSSRDASEMQRTKSSLIRLLQTTADRYKRSIETNNSKVKKYRHNLAKIFKGLDGEAIVKFAQNIPEACSLEVEDYASDVVFTASHLPRKGRDTVMAKVIVIEEPINSKTIYHLKEKIIQRQV